MSENRAPENKTAAKLLQIRKSASVECSDDAGGRILQSVSRDCGVLIPVVLVNVELPSNGRWSELISFRPVPWWLWPNVLCVDAPAVAVSWQWFLAGASGHSLAPEILGVLGITVWLLYAVDRWLDARKLKDLSFAADRHIFLTRRRSAAFTLLAVVAVLDVFAARQSIPIAIWLAGAPLAGVTALYFVAIHLTPGRWRFLRRTPWKELCVGLLFASGVLLPIVASPAADAISYCFLWAALTLLFAYNCLLITSWEAPDEMGLASGFVLESANIGCLGLLWFQPSFAGAAKIGATIALSMLLLNGLRFFGRVFGPRALRLLADVALTTPLIWIFAS